MISVVLSLLMLGVFLVGMVARKRSPPVAVGIMSVALVGFWFAWRPDDLTSIAHLMGVGRGTDLGLYLAISLCLLTIAALLVQLRHLQVRFTRLAREVALMQARSAAARPEFNVQAQRSASDSPPWKSGQ